MTQQQTAKMLTVMQAFIDGAEIQCYSHASEAGWEACPAPVWNWMHCEYRVKPTPTLIPWTRETVPPLPCEVRFKDTKDRTCIMGAGLYALWINGASIGMSYQKALEELERPDGSPCGEVSK